MAWLLKETFGPAETLTPYSGHGNLHWRFKGIKFKLSRALLAESSLRLLEFSLVTPTIVKAVELTVFTFRRWTKYIFIFIYIFIFRILFGKLCDTDQTYDQRQKKNMLCIFLKNITTKNYLFAVLRFQQMPFFWLHVPGHVSLFYLWARLVNGLGDICVTCQTVLVNIWLSSILLNLTGN